VTVELRRGAVAADGRAFASGWWMEHAAWATAAGPSGELVIAGTGNQRIRVVGP
jgi:hypothetical protein